jgi:hypothetical protein
VLGTKANRMRFKALSLIDITKTGVSRNKEAEDQKAVAQFANYMTVENCLQLRSNIKILTVPKAKKMDISNLKFGDNYRGEQMVWEFTFEPEIPEAISVKTLNEDFNLIPMLTGLDETIKISNGVYITDDEDYTNLLFIKQIDNE